MTKRINSPKIVLENVLNIFRRKYIGLDLSVSEFEDDLLGKTYRINFIHDNEHTSFCIPESWMHEKNSIHDREDYPNDCNWYLGEEVTEEINSFILNKINGEEGGE